MTVGQIAQGLQFLGLVVNGIGALLIALAQKAISKEQHQVTSIGKDPLVVLKHPCAWFVGLWMMFGGFSLQVFGSFLGFIQR